MRLLISGSWVRAPRWAKLFSVFYLFLLVENLVGLHPEKLATLEEHYTTIVIEKPKKWHIYWQILGKIDSPASSVGRA